MLNSVQTEKICFNSVIFGLLLWQGQSHAGPLFNTDDAAITDFGHCQFESSLRRLGSHGHALHVSPICSVMQNLELSLGFHKQRMASESEQRLSLQAKSIIQALHSDGWAVAVSALVEQKTTDRHDRSWTVNFPMTKVLQQDKLQLDSSLGYSQNQQDKLFLASLAVNYAIRSNQVLSAEIFNQDYQAAVLQVGFGHAVIPEVLTIEVAYQHGLDRNTDPVLGLGLVFAPRF